MDTICKELLEQKEVRTNLSRLRQLIKEAEKKRQCQDFFKEHKDVLTGFLNSEDAKIRKNAALLLGDLDYRSAADALFEAYWKEDTRFVRSSYLQALAKLEYSEKNEKLRSRLKELMELPVEEETRKHMEEEIRQLRKILIGQEGIPGHTFDAQGNTMNVLLITNRENKEFIRQRVPVGRAVIHPLGILVETSEIEKLMNFRLFRDLVFPLRLQQGKLLSEGPREAAGELWKSDLYEILKKLHLESGEFYFRLEIKGPMSLEERSDFSKKLSGELEKLSGGMLVNSTSNYEVEIRLILNREGRFFPCLKLYTIADNRFSYRKNVIASSIHPSTAALIAELAKPYLQENAQVMDPFCGVGTMLIERNHNVRSHDMYGTDIFGEAIDKARENAENAGVGIHFINRNFFDFTHDYKFDEIITNMPVRGRKTKEEMDQFYGAFFRKLPQICNDRSVVIMYTNEVGFVKKQLRLHEEYRLMKEIKMHAGGEYYLFLIRIKRR